MSALTAREALDGQGRDARPPQARRMAYTGKVPAVVAVDVTGRVKYVNALVECFSGSKRHELLDQPLSRVFGADQSEAGRTAATVTRQAMTENRWAWMLEDCWLAPDEASSTAMEFHAAPIRERDGSVTGAVLVFCQVGD
jgi:PAS domain S-box-containing protein